MLTFPVAYGLALQGLGVARLQTNLLPPEITFDRKIRAKKPYAVAAAAALLARARRSWPTATRSRCRTCPTRRSRTAIAKAKSVVSAAEDGGRADRRPRRTEIDKTQTEVESIIAGQAERKNWIAINKFVNESVPVPGPVDREEPGRSPATTT